jgi:excisionase family DNA binding protein
VLASAQARSDLEFHMGSSPSFFSEKEAAAYLSVSLSTIRRWRRTKTGPELFRFGGVLRYSREALDVFIANNTRTAA